MKEIKTEIIVIIILTIMVMSSMVTMNWIVPVTIAGIGAITLIVIEERRLKKGSE